jgi:hypothetical protein
LSDKSEPFRDKGHKHSGDITLKFSEGDAAEVVRSLEQFCQTQLPKIIPAVSVRLAKTVLADLSGIAFAPSLERRAAASALDKPSFAGGAAEAGMRLDDCFILVRNTV